MKKLLLLLPVLLIASACVQLPQPITETRPKVVPAWTVKQAEARRAEVMKAVNDAARTKKESTALQVTDDIDRTIMAAQWDYQDKYGGDLPTDMWRQGQVTGVWSTSAISYPQTAVVLVALKTDKDSKITQAVEVYTRKAAAAAWLRSATALLSGRLSWPKSGSLITTPPKRLNGLSTERVPELMSALNDPKSKAANRFTANEALTSGERVRADLAKEKDYGRTWATSSTAGTTWGLVTPTGAFLIAPTTFTQNWNYKDGITYRWTDPDFKRYWKGKDYTGATFTDIVVYAIQVPRNGKITIAGEDRTFASLSSY